MNAPPPSALAVGLRRSAPRWLVPLLCITALLALDLFVGRLIRPRTLSKGSTAPYTLRAATDVVFDLRQTVAEEARVARRNYLPIYDKDGEILYTTRSATLEAVREMPAGAWPWPPVGLATPLSPTLDAGPVPKDTNQDPRLARLEEKTAGHRRESRSAKVVAPERAGQATPPPALATIHSRRRDAGTTDGGAAGQGTAVPEMGMQALREARQREIEALVRACFKLLEPIYQDGVIADHEFPSRKEAIRVAWIDPFADAEETGTDSGDDAEDPSQTIPEASSPPSPQYVVREVSTLHRFSSLRPELRKHIGEFFFRTAAPVREQVVDFVLGRLPPNLTYARENKQVIDISEVTGVEVVLIRRGDILARRGQYVDSRAHYALRASRAAAGRVGRVPRSLAQGGLLVGLFVAFVLLGQRNSLLFGRSLPAQLILYGGIVLTALLGFVMLALTPAHAALVPQATLALIIAVRYGRGPAALAALLLPAALGIARVLPPAAMVVGLTGGLLAALLSERRSRNRLPAAGIMVGLVQALALASSGAVAGHSQTYSQLIAAAQAFFGGAISGVLALLVLPFVQRWTRQASEGKLRVLYDYEHPIARRLRERQPATFAHTVRVVSLADRAAQALGADRLLVRCAALYHEIEQPPPADTPPDEQPHGDADEQSAPARAEGRRQKAAEHHPIPPEVRHVIEEHRGTLPALLGRTDPRGARADSEGAQGPQARGHHATPSQGEARCRITTNLRPEDRQGAHGLRPTGHREKPLPLPSIAPSQRIDRDSAGLPPGDIPGLKPRSMEGAILMIANCVEERLADRSEAAEDAVEKTLDMLHHHRQLDNCPLTQRQLGQLSDALITYLKEHQSDS